MAGIHPRGPSRPAGRALASLPRIAFWSAKPACRRSRRRHQLESIRTRAASPSSDPYQVLPNRSIPLPCTSLPQILGVSRKTSSENVQRAYRARLLEAKKTGDDDLVNTIEQAHSSIMMEELTRRMQVCTVHSLDLPKRS